VVVVVIVVAVVALVVLTNYAANTELEVLA
jgi:hypothetical protein